MRELKFRAWDEVEKSFFCIGPSQRMTINELFKDLQEKECSIEQFTGLHDKNGDEIYNGDLLKDSTGVSLVTWNEKFSSFCLTRRGWLSDHFFGEAADPEDCEVIGNIHQNSEILK